MGNPRRVTTTLDRSSECPNLASVFQAFDRLRQQLSFQTHGVAGAFTGFATLNAHPELLTDSRTPSGISLSATVIGETSRATRVEYRATFSRETCTGWRTWVIVSGSGVTTHPPTRRIDARAVASGVDRHVAMAGA